MSSVFSYPARRRPFVPYDPNAPDDGPSVFSPAPDLGGGGAPQDQPPPQMFTPPPNNAFQPPLQSNLAEATSILQGAGRGSAFAPAQFQTSAIEQESIPRLQAIRERLVHLAQGAEY